MGDNTYTPTTAAYLRSTKMLKLVVAAAVMLHVVASKPMEVNVEVTVNGVKIPINNLPPPATSKEPKTGGLMYGWDDKGKEPKTGGLMYGWSQPPPDKGEIQAKSGGYGTWFDLKSEVGKPCEPPRCGKKIVPKFDCKKDPDYTPLLASTIRSIFK